jgi:ubiquinone biosynthesis protein
MELPPGVVLDPAGPLLPRILGRPAAPRETLFSITPPAPSETPRVPREDPEAEARERFPHLPAETATILRSVDRNKPFEAETAPRIPPSRMRQIVFRATYVQVVQRLGVWLFAGVLFAAGTLRDIVLRRDRVERRARRLRWTFERIGGTFVKVGQQLSARVDLLPSAYCDALAHMLDKVPPIRTAVAIQTIERSTGRPLHETFAEFDPKPIGSASIGCVYLGVLKSGERVAVKVRRPGIGRVFAADLTALDWFMQLLETLTIVRPGLFKNFRSELRAMLLEELDYRREARFTEIFRRSARKKGWKFISAPKVIYDLSGEDVLVTEYVTGVWLSELLAAVEGADDEALKSIRALDIDPKKVGRRLWLSSLFGQFDSFVFHADPHPANIVVQPGNKLVFIDFGACGSYTEPERRIQREILHQMVRRDVSALARCGMAMIEPLPPIDTHELGKRLEAAYWQLIHAFESKHTEWWERTSAGFWLQAIQVTSEYQLPMPLNMLRVIRATLLYDSLASRLDPKPDIGALVRKFDDRVARRRRKEAARALTRDARRFDLGAALVEGYAAARDARDVGQRALFRLNRALDSDRHAFTDQIRKASYAALDLLRLAATASFVTAGATAAVVAYGYAMGRGVRLEASLLRVLTSGWYAGFLALLGVQHARRLAFRFSEPDVGTDR